MESKGGADNKPVHIINIDIQDNHEEATMGAFLICDLVAMVRLHWDISYSFPLKNLIPLTISDIAIDWFFS